MLDRVGVLAGALREMRSASADFRVVHIDAKNFSRRLGNGLRVVLPDISRHVKLLSVGEREEERHQERLQASEPHLAP